MNGASGSQYQRLRGHLHYLRLQAAAEALPAELERAVADKAGPSAFLERLLQIEVEATERRRRESRLKFACLPAPWTLEDLDFEAQPALDRSLVAELATLRFVAEATNVLILGPPGVGKTMLAVCLGRRACEAGYRVYYTSAADLVARLHRAALEGRWATTLRFFSQPSVLICDELGYLPLRGEAGAALFQVVARRYLKGSIILTTNRGIASWGEIFDDPMVAAAMLDRLLHRAAVVGIDGPSYRLRHHQRTADTLRAATGHRQQGGPHAS